MFKQVKIENFRGIKQVDLDDFRLLNLVVGKNNSGKSTILESLFLLVDPTNPRLPINITVFRGHDIMTENYWKLIFNNLNENLNIKLTAKLDKQNQERVLIIKPNKESFTLSFIGRNISNK